MDYSEVPGGTEGGRKERDGWGGAGQGWEVGGRDRD